MTLNISFGRAALAAAATLTLAHSATANWVTASDAEGEYVRGRVIVAPRAGLAEEALGKIVKTHGGRARAVGKSGLYIVELPEQASETAVVQQLAHNPHLKFAELDRVFEPAFVPNDPYFGSQWHTAKIGTSTAWDLAQGVGVTIAILDTGVDGAHPDLVDRVVPGWNFYDNNSNTSDVYGHGTPVAGAAAATLNNTKGVAAVAGSARIMPIRITSTTGSASSSTIAQAITYAADKGARVASMSYAGLAGNSTVQTAAQYLKNKGGLLVVAAGNNSRDEGVAATTTLIPVSATDRNDVITSFSSYGSFIAVAAPGIDIYSTGRGGVYGTYGGTSLATPVVAGVIALIMSAKPTLSASQVESILYSTAVDLGTAGRDKYYGHGRVNAAAAVQAALNSTPTTTDTTKPMVAISSPTASSSVSGLVPVNVSATDNVGVSKVVLRVNGTTVATDSAAPFAFSWDSTKVANGSASLSAVAYDAAGNSAVSSTVSVNVANSTAVVSDTSPPSVRFLSPLGGTVNGMVSVSTSATDNMGTSGIRQSLYIDGALATTSTGGTLRYKWNSRKGSRGSHTLQVVARDQAGNTSTAQVQVSN